MKSDLLAGKVCLVTGASRGIGRATAELFSAQGAHVVLASRNEPALDATAAACSQLGAASVFAQLCDVSEEAQVARLFQAVFKRHRRLDVLHANAGVMEDALIGMVSSAMLERLYRTNVFGLMYCAQYASRMMGRAGGGSIIAMASIVGEHGHAGQSAYAGTKAAVSGVVRSLAKELAPQFIRVNGIAPGFIDTSMTAALPAAKSEALRRAIGWGRAGTASDVAAVALFLASDLSVYVTGQILGVDGALVL